MCPTFGHVTSVHIPSTCYSPTIRQLDAMVSAKDSINCFVVSRGQVVRQSPRGDKRDGRNEGFK